MQKLTVNISEEHKDFLGLLMHEDAAANLSEAVHWCINNCIQIEKTHGIDACYIAYFGTPIAEKLADALETLEAAAMGKGYFAGLPASAPTPDYMSKSHEALAEYREVMRKLPKPSHT